MQPQRGGQSGQGGAGRPSAPQARGASMQDAGQEFILDFEEDEEEQELQPWPPQQQHQGCSSGGGQLPGQPPDQLSAEAMSAEIERLRLQIAQKERMETQKARGLQKRSSLPLSGTSGPGSNQPAAAAAQRVGTQAVQGAGVRGISLPQPGSLPANGHVQPPTTSSPARRAVGQQPANSPVKRKVSLAGSGTAGAAQQVPPAAAIQAKNLQSAQAFLELISGSISPPQPKQTPVAAAIRSPFSQPGAAKAVGGQMQASAASVSDQPVVTTGTARAGRAGSAVLRRASSDLANAGQQPSRPRQASPNQAMHPLQRSAVRVAALVHAAAMDMQQPGRSKTPGRVAARVASQLTSPGDNTRRVVRVAGQPGASPGSTAVTPPAAVARAALQQVSKSAGTTPSSSQGVWPGPVGATSPQALRPAQQQQRRPAATQVTSEPVPPPARPSSRVPAAASMSQALVLHSPGPAQPAPPAAPGGFRAAGLAASLAAGLAAGQPEPMSQAELDARARQEYVLIRWNILMEQQRRAQAEWEAACAALREARGLSIEEEPTPPLPGTFVAPDAGVLRLMPPGRSATPSSAGTAPAIPLARSRTPSAAGAEPATAKAINRPLAARGAPTAPPAATAPDATAAPLPGGAGQKQQAKAGKPVPVLAAGMQSSVAAAGQAAPARSAAAAVALASASCATVKAAGTDELVPGAAVPASASGTAKHVGSAVGSGAASGASPRPEPSSPASRAAASGAAGAGSLLEQRRAQLEQWRLKQQQQQMPPGPGSPVRSGAGGTLPASPSARQQPATGQASQPQQQQAGATAAATSKMAGSPGSGKPNPALAPKLMSNAAAALKRVLSEVVVPDGSSLAGHAAASAEQQPAVKKPRLASAAHVPAAEQLAKEDAAAKPAGSAIATKSGGDAKEQAVNSAVVNEAGNAANDKPDGAAPAASAAPAVSKSGVLQSTVDSGNHAGGTASQIAAPNDAAAGRKEAKSGTAEQQSSRAWVGRSRQEREQGINKGRDRDDRDRGGSRSKDERERARSRSRSRRRDERGRDRSRSRGRAGRRSRSPGRADRHRRWSKGRDERGRDRSRERDARERGSSRRRDGRSRSRTRDERRRDLGTSRSRDREGARGSNREREWDRGKDRDQDKEKEERATRREGERERSREVREKPREQEEERLKARPAAAAGQIGGAAAPAAAVSSASQGQAAAAAGTANTDAVNAALAAALLAAVRPAQADQAAAKPSISQPSLTVASQSQISQPAKTDATAPARPIAAAGTTATASADAVNAALAAALQAAVYPAQAGQAAVKPFISQPSATGPAQSQTSQQARTNVTAPARPFAGSGAPQPSIQQPTSAATQPLAPASVQPATQPSSQAPAKLPAQSIARPPPSAAVQAPAQQPAKQASQLPTQPPAKQAAQLATQPQAQLPGQGLGQSPQVPHPPSTQPPAQAPAQKALPSPAQPPVQPPAQPPVQPPAQPMAQLPTQKPVQASVQPTAQLPPKSAPQPPAQTSTQWPVQKPGLSYAQATAQPLTQVPVQKPGLSYAQAAAQQAAQPTAQRLVQLSNQKPMQTPAQSTAQQPAQRMAQLPIQKPVQTPAQPTAQQLAKAPAQLAVQKPAQPSNQAPSQQPAPEAARAPAQPVAQLPAQGPLQSSVQVPTYPLTQPLQQLVTNLQQQPSHPPNLTPSVSGNQKAAQQPLPAVGQEALQSLLHAVLANSKASAQPASTAASAQPPSTAALAQPASAAASAQPPSTAASAQPPSTAGSAQLASTAALERPRSTSPVDASSLWQSLLAGGLTSMGMSQPAMRTSSAAPGTLRSGSLPGVPSDVSAAPPAAVNTTRAASLSVNLNQEAARLALEIAGLPAVLSTRSSSLSVNAGRPATLGTRSSASDLSQEAARLAMEIAGLPTGPAAATLSSSTQARLSTSPANPSQQMPLPAAQAPQAAGSGPSQQAHLPAAQAPQAAGSGPFQPVPLPASQAQQAAGSGPSQQAPSPAAQATPQPQVAAQPVPDRPLAASQTPPTLPAANSSGPASASIPPSDTQRPPISALAAQHQVYAALQEQQALAAKRQAPTQLPAPMVVQPQLQQQTGQAAHQQAGQRPQQAAPTARSEHQRQLAQALQQGLKQGLEQALPAQPPALLPSTTNSLPSGSLPALPPAVVPPPPPALTPFLPFTTGPSATVPLHPKPPSLDAGLAATQPPALLPAPGPALLPPAAPVPQDAGRVPLHPDPRLGGPGVIQHKLLPNPAQVAVRPGDVLPAPPGAILPLLTPVAGPAGTPAGLLAGQTATATAALASGPAAAAGALPAARARQQTNAQQQLVNAVQPDDVIVLSSDEDDGSAGPPLWRPPRAGRAPKRARSPSLQQQQPHRQLPPSGPVASKQGQPTAARVPSTDMAVDMDLCSDDDCMVVTTTDAAKGQPCVPVPPPPPPPPPLLPNATGPQPSAPQPAAISAPPLLPPPIPVPLSQPQQPGLWPSQPSAPDAATQLPGHQLLQATVPGGTDAGPGSRRSIQAKKRDPRLQHAAQQQLAAAQPTPDVALGGSAAPAATATASTAMGPGVQNTQSPSTAPAVNAVDPGARNNSAHPTISAPSPAGPSAQSNPLGPHAPATSAAERNNPATGAAQSLPSSAPTSTAPLARPPRAPMRPAVNQHLSSGNSTQPPVARHADLSRVYRCPLLSLRAYRLTNTYKELGNANPRPTSPALCNALDAVWPLCRFDLRGSCRDMRCRMQHMQDTELNGVAAKQELEVRSQAVASNDSVKQAYLENPASVPLSRMAEACAISPAVRALFGQGRAAHVAREARIQAGLEADQDAPSKPTGAELQVASFSSALLSTAAPPSLSYPCLAWTSRVAAMCCTARDDRPAAATNSVLQGLCQQAANSKQQQRTEAIVLGSRAAVVVPLKGRVMSDARQNRYFSSGSTGPAGAGSNQDPISGQQRIDGMYRQLQPLHGSTPIFWLQWACEQLGYGDVPHTKADRTAALDILAEGIERLSGPPAAPTDADGLASCGMLLCLALCLSALEGTQPRDSRHTQRLQSWQQKAAEAIRTGQLSSAVAYRLCLAQAKHAQSWQEVLDILHQGLLACSRTLSTEPGALAHPTDSHQDTAACCVDLALRMLQNVCDAGHARLARLWAQTLIVNDISGEIMLAQPADAVTCLLLAQPNVRRALRFARGPAAQLLRRAHDALATDVDCLPQELLQGYPTDPLPQAALTATPADAGAALADAWQLLQLPDGEASAEPFGSLSLQPIVPVDLLGAQPQGGAEQSNAGALAARAAAAAQQRQALQRNIAARLRACLLGPPLQPVHSALRPLQSAVLSCRHVEQAHAISELALLGLRHTPELATLLLQLARFQPLPSAAWHHASNLGWSHYVLPLLASALLEAHPPASAQVWHESVEVVRCVSVSAAIELLAAAQSVYPHSLKLWRQRAVLAGPPGSAPHTAVILAARAVGFELPV